MTTKAPARRLGPGADSRWPVAGSSGAGGQDTMGASSTSVSLTV